MDTFSPQECDLFDAYDAGTLSADARSALEQQLAADPVLRDKLRLYQLLLAQSREEARLQQQLKMRFQKVDQRQRKRRMGRLLMIAASTIGIAAFALWLLKPAADQSFDDLDVGEPGLPILMQDADVSLWTPVMLHFSEENYAEALNDLNQLPTTDTSHYFRGYFLEKQRQTTPALEAYSMAASGNSLWASKASYRKALLLARSGADHEARLLFALLAADPGFIYQQQAKKALQRLK